MKDTRIRLCRGINIDSGYQHTLYFNSEAERQSYFSDHSDFIYNNSQYTRTSDNSVKIPRNKDDLDSVNYMVIQNGTEHNAKWYYCFVDEIRYISDTTSEIFFTVDVLQTWLPDCRFGKSYIVRNHTLTDEIGENVVPESVDMGDHYTASHVSYMYQYLTAVEFTETNTLSLDTAQTNWLYRQIVPSKVDILSYHKLDRYNEDGTPATGNEIGLMNLHIKQTDPERFMSVLMIPEKCCAQPDWIYTQQKPTTIQADPLDAQNIFLPDRIDDYEPRNKKLFTAPFCVLNVENGEGAFLTFAFEDFDQDGPDHKAKFNAYYIKGMSPEVDLVPVRYKGMAENFGERITMNRFPSVPITVNMLEQYKDRNGLQFIASTVASLAGSIAPAVISPSPVTGGLALQGVTSTLGQIAGEGVKQESMKKIPDSVKFIDSNSTFDQMTGNKRFTFSTFTVTADAAERIDAFFDRYGYAIKKMDIPVLKARKEWTYIQTAGLTLFGNVAQNVTEKIKKIFDAGVTFWVNPENVGNYNLPNEPTGDAPEPEPVPGDFIPRLTNTGIYNAKYWRMPLNRYAERTGIALPGCSSYAYGRSLEIADRAGKMNLIMNADGTPGAYDWKGGRSTYGSPCTVGEHYPYPSGEDCVDAAKLGGWEVTRYPRLGDIVSYYYDGCPSSHQNGHALIVEQILERDADGHAIDIVCSESSSGVELGKDFDTRRLKKGYHLANNGQWVANTPMQGDWYDSQGSYPKKWCGGFAHNPALS